MDRDRDMPEGPERVEVPPEAGELPVPRFVDCFIRDAEDRADRLALELLAPESAVLELAWARRLDWGLPAARGEAEQLLVDLYGLPRWAASCYAGLLAVRHGPPPTFRQWLGPAGKS